MPTGNKSQSHPYNDQHYDLACQVLGTCGQLDAEIQRYRRAGFDELGMPLDAMQQEVDAQKTSMTKFKAEFFPGKP